MESATAGLRQAAREVLATLVDAGQTRLQLAATELEEERLRLARLLLCATGALFLLGVGIVLAAGALVLWCAPENRLLALAGLSLAFVFTGLLAVWHWLRLAQAKPPLLNATLGELRQDADSLRGSAP